MSYTFNPFTGNFDYFASTSPGGSNTQVQFNDGGVFGGNAAFTFDSGTGTVSATIFNGSIAGSNVSLTDAGGYFITDNAEAALQQVGANLTTLNTRVPSGLGTNRILYAVSDNITSEAAFTYNPSTNEMVVGSGGQILIGDTSVITTPDKHLHIVSDTVSSGGTDSPGIYIEATDTTVFASNVIANIDILGGEAGGRGVVGQLVWKSNGSWTNTASPTDMFLSCTPSGSLVIDASTTLVMKATGGLGWGTDNPRSKFHLVSTKNALSDLDNANFYTTVFSTESDTNGTSVSLGFSVDATFTTVGGSIVYERTGDNSKGIMHFYVKQDTGVGNPTEALSLEDDGQVILYGNTTIGSGTTGVDYSVRFNGRFNDGTITWMDDENYFSFSDTIKLNRRVIRSKSTYTGTDTTDDIYIHKCNSASAFTLTVLDGGYDGEEIIIYNINTGVVTLSGNISTITATSTLNQGESLVLRWDSTDSEWQ